MSIATSIPPAQIPPRSGAVRSSHGEGQKAYAALDLGTNNCRLLVAVPEHADETSLPERPGQPGRPIFRVVDAFSRIVRLGEGLGQMGVLADSAMDRAVSALRVCASKLRRHQLAATRLVATEACRRAANCDAFLARVRNEIGISIEIITTAEEARLALDGCAPLLEPGFSRAVVFDIGGGSTEINWLGVDGLGMPQPIDAISLPFGVVTLGERFGDDRIAPATYEAMVAEVMTGLGDFERRHGIGAWVARGGVQMLGTSGTVTTLAGIHLGLPRYDRSVVDGSYLSFDAVAAVTHRLVGLDCLGRAAHPCIGRERADLVLAGCAILEAICRQWPVGRLRVADRGVREGILCGLMRRDGFGRRVRPAYAAEPAL